MGAQPECRIVSGGPDIVRGAGTVGQIELTLKS